MRKLFKYAWRGRWFYLFSLMGLCIAVTSDAFRPMVTSRIIDEVLVARDTSNFFFYILLLIGLSSLMALGYYLQEYLSDRISSLSHKGMRRDLFSHIQSLDMSFFSRNNPAELMSRTKQDVENVGFCFGFIAVFALEITVHTLLFLIMLSRISLYGLIVPVLLMPLIFLIAFLAEKKGDEYYDKISDETATMNDTAGEALSGIRTVKAFGREEYEKKKFRVHNRRFRMLNLQVDFLWANTMAPMSALARLMQVLSILSSGILVIKGRITLGEAAAITLYVGELAWPMMDLGWVLQAISTALASSRKINDILETESRIADGDQEASSSGALEFSHVGLTLEGKDILKDVSFRLEKGRSLGIMGSTGSGKSTICNLALRFLDPSQGTITFDGVDIRQLTLKSLRDRFAVVTQDVFLFSDQIDENVRIGHRQDAHLDKEKIASALKMAHASEFVDRLENAEKTVIGEKGVGLSGGQKQRLSIARAFYRNAPILILDDATSALDMETEKDIQRTLEKNKGAGRIIVAHRISAVRNCSEILFLEKGRVAERGTHDTLMKKKGLYYETYVAQYGEV